MPQHTPQSETNKSSRKTIGKKITPRRIAAFACIILLVCLYVGGLLLVCFNPGNSERLFAGWLGSVIGLPILLWLLLWSLQLLKKRQEENRPPQHTNTETGQNADSPAEHH